MKTIKCPRGDSLKPEKLFHVAKLEGLYKNKSIWEFLISTVLLGECYGVKIRKLFPDSNGVLSWSGGPEASHHVDKMRGGGVSGDNVPGHHWLWDSISSFTWLFYQGNQAFSHWFTDENSHDTLLQVSLAFGLGVMSIACFTGHISGGVTISSFWPLIETKQILYSGNLNPAVSLGLLVGGQLSLIKAICIHQTLKNRFSPL